MGCLRVLVFQSAPFFTWAGRCYGTIGRSRPLTGHSHGSSSESLSNSWLEARKEHLMQ